MEFDNQYLEYEEYVELGGSLERTPFNILELEARKNIDKYTFGRLANLDEQIEETKICVFKLINLINTYSSYENQSKGISSENIDGYNVSYSQISENISKAKSSEIKDIITTCLSGCCLDDKTPYLYCGGGKWSVTII